MPDTPTSNSNEAAGDQDGSQGYKTERTNKKRLVTRKINTLKQYIAEEDVNGIKEEVGKLKSTFKAFKDVHFVYHDGLENDNDIDESEVYFTSVQDSYIEVLNAVKLMNISGGSSSDNSKSHDNDLSRSELLSLMNMPKLTLDPFGGDPLEFHTFMLAFDQTVDVLPGGDDIKLTRLIEYTKGQAKDAIRKCVLMDPGVGYQKAREILQTRFGNKYLVTEKIISEMKYGKQIRSAAELSKFADELEANAIILQRLGQTTELDTQASVVQILKRLQPFIQNRWKRKALEVKREREFYPNFADFVRFISETASDLNDPVYGKLENKSHENKHHVNHQVVKGEHTKFKEQQFKKPMVNGYGRQEQKCILCHDNHRLWHCKVFREKSPRERLELVKTNNLCENCLLNNHSTAQCKKPSVCSVPGCGEKHTKFLHEIDTEELRDVQANTAIDSDVLMPIIPVLVNGRHKVHALLDTGSTGSFCTQEMVEKLGLNKKPVTYTLGTLSASKEIRNTSSVNFEVTDVDSEEVLSLSEVLVIKEIPVSKTPSSVDFPHLKDVPFTRGDVKVDLLIGQDNAEALIPLEVIRGQKGEPFAVKTLFGWTVNGPMSNVTSHRIISNYIKTQNLESRLDELWNIECNDGCEETLMSQEDHKVLKLWDENLNRENNNYVLPIPWRDNTRLQDNRDAAISRLTSLTKSLNKRGIMDRYRQELEKLVEKNYAEEVPAEEVNRDKDVWYLPHHAVMNDKKPDKLRIVFDCAAKFKGESLNSRCLKGPDLNNKLLHVLLRFREHQYAVTSDIEAMYYQVKVDKRNRNALRFIWKDEDSQEVKTYRMTAHVFGGVCGVLPQLMHSEGQPKIIM